MAFNNGKPFHGSSDVEGGRLRGRTGETDYFFFLCPRCEGEQVMRILEYELEPTPPVERQERKQPKTYFRVAFHLYCPICECEDFVKMDNTHPSGHLRRAASA